MPAASRVTTCAAHVLSCLDLVHFSTSRIGCMQILVAALSSARIFVCFRYAFTRLRFASPCVARLIAVAQSRGLV